MKVSPTYKHFYQASTWWKWLILYRLIFRKLWSSSSLLVNLPFYRDWFFLQADRFHKILLDHGCAGLQHRANGPLVYAIFFIYCHALFIFLIIIVHQSSICSLVFIHASMLNSIKKSKFQCGNLTLYWAISTRLLVFKVTQSAIIDAAPISEDRFENKIRTRLIMNKSPLSLYFNGTQHSDNGITVYNFAEHSRLY